MGWLEHGRHSKDSRLRKDLEKILKEHTKDSVRQSPSASPGSKVLDNLCAWEGLNKVQRMGLSCVQPVPIVDGH